MVPNERLTAPGTGSGLLRVRGTDGDRLDAARADLLRAPAPRLSDQERALMHAMLLDLVSTIADEIAAALNPAPGNDRDHRQLLERLRSAGLLDIDGLLSALLRRSEEERLSAALRLRSGARQARFLHSLAGDPAPDVSSAAVALMLGRGRRRDSQDKPRLVLDDLPREAAQSLVYSIAAATSTESGARHDWPGANTARALLDRHDARKRMDSLGLDLARALDEDSRLDEAMMKAALADGELGFFVDSLACHARIDSGASWDNLARAGGLALLLRMAGVSRQFAAGTIGSLAEFLPGSATAEIDRFESCSPELAEQNRAWLQLDRRFREAVAAFGDGDGKRAL